MQDLTESTGSTLTAAEYNQATSEIKNVIESQGISLSGSDLSQLTKAVANYAAGGQFFTGGGSANAYTANAQAPRQNPTKRQEGQVIQFIAPANNTGASTLNAFGLGVSDIKLKDGTDTLEGDIVAGEEVTIIDKVTYYELDLKGKAATQAEVEAGVNDSKVVTPQKLRFGFSALIQSNGYLIFPSWLGGLIFQWGSAGVGSSTEDTTSSLTIPFPSEALFLVLQTRYTPESGLATTNSAWFISLSEFTFRASISYHGAVYFAIGR